VNLPVSLRGLKIFQDARLNYRGVGMLLPSSQKIHILNMVIQLSLIFQLTDLPFVG